MVIFIAVFAMILVPAVAAKAQTTTETLVRERCSSVKLLLDQQRRRDLVSRINRGRAYQNSIDRLQALTDRVRNNQLNTQPFEQQQATFIGNFNAFRNAYAAYDDALGTLLDIDCADKPGEFLAQLARVRQLRGVVADQVAQIESILGRYREIISNLRAELERLQNAVLGEEQP